MFERYISAYYTNAIDRGAVRSIKLRSKQTQIMPRQSNFTHSIASDEQHSYSVLHGSREVGMVSSTANYGGVDFVTSV